MKSQLKLGLIIAFFFSALSMTALAQPADSSAKSKVKKHHVKKQPVKKGKRAVVKHSKSKHAEMVKSKKSVSDETAKLSTDINFNDSVLHGRYQTPDEATAKVENEKSLADLLAVRTEFKDRLKKSSEQN